MPHETHDVDFLVDHHCDFACPSDVEQRVWKLAMSRLHAWSWKTARQPERCQDVVSRTSLYQHGRIQDPSSADGPHSIPEARALVLHLSVWCKLPHTKTSTIHNVTRNNIHAVLPFLAANISHARTQTGPNNPHAPQQGSVCAANACCACCMSWRPSFAGRDGPGNGSEALGGRGIKAFLGHHIPRTKRGRVVNKGSSNHVTADERDTTICNYMMHMQRGSVWVYFFFQIFRYPVRIHLMDFMSQKPMMWSSTQDCYIKSPGTFAASFYCDRWVYPVLCGTELTSATWLGYNLEHWRQIYLMAWWDVPGLRSFLGPYGTKQMETWHHKYVRE